MLVWMDLEMTGLDINRHVIVEMATVITDDDLENIITGPDLVIHASDEELSQMDSYVEKMHSNSGLLDAIRTSTISIDQAVEASLAFIKEHVKSPRSVPLCGNSIGTDRRFLDKYAPSIEEFLHYRSIDVSTLKELARRWNKQVLESAPKKAVGHRALDDILESVAELKHYRDNFMQINKG
ncbi:MAG: oligoribonuclease [Actinomycetota bacterium]|nr:oligoribonuclease [Actinomycetota bacterium]